MKESPGSSTLLLGLSFINLSNPIGMKCKKKDKEILRMIRKIS